METRAVFKFSYYAWSGRVLNIQRTIMRHENGYMVVNLRPLGRIPTKILIARLASNKVEVV